MRNTAIGRLEHDDAKGVPILLHHSMCGEFWGLQLIFSGGLFRVLPERQQLAGKRQDFAAPFRIGIDGHSTDEHLAVF